jgi:hypothetical protein
MEICMFEFPNGVLCMQTPGHEARGLLRHIDQNEPKDREYFRGYVMAEGDYRHDDELTPSFLLGYYEQKRWAAEMLSEVDDVFVPGVDRWSD